MLKILYHILFALSYTNSRVWMRFLVPKLGAGIEILKVYNYFSMETACEAHFIYTNLRGPERLEMTTK